MAIYHFTVKVISRGKGQSAVASAAYRAGEKLFNERLDKHHDYRNKRNVIFSEIALPACAPKRLQAREVLWNEVERCECRDDAQLAREVEFALPIELGQEQAIALARNFIQEQFVSKGMIADWNVHWEEHNPHVHVMLSLREVNERGFGKKVREWNRKELLKAWREQWAVHANAYLEKHHVTIDHRSYEERGINLIPTIHLGKNVIEMSKRNINTDILNESNSIWRKNLKRINKKPSQLVSVVANEKDTVTIKSLSQVVARYLLKKSDSSIIDKIITMLERHDAIFDEKQLEKELLAYVHDAETFTKVIRKLKSSLIYLGKDKDGRDHYTSRKMLSIEKSIHEIGKELSHKKHVYISQSMRQKLLNIYQKQHEKTLTLEQQMALMHLTSDKSLVCLVGKAGTGKSFLFSAAKEIWRSKQLNVQGIAMLGIAAERLQQDTGIPTRTLASFRIAIESGIMQLTSKDVIVMDEAGITDSASMLFVLKLIKEANAKLVLVGDPQQLQPIAAGAMFRSLLEQLGYVSLEKIYRQKEVWQREATHDFSIGDVYKGLTAYQKNNCIHFEESNKCIDKLISHWETFRGNQKPLIMAHRKKDVAALNAAIRSKLINSKEIEEGLSIETIHGKIKISEKERILFLKNNKDFDVRNGSFGTITAIKRNAMGDVSKITVQLDENRKIITFAPNDYPHVTHGYAATVHKVQGITVNNSFVYVAGKKWDSHLMYVAMSRHKENTFLYVDKASCSNLNDLESLLQRTKQKENAIDFIRQFSARRGIKNENDNILRRLKKLDRNIKLSKQQPYAYLKIAAKEAFEKYVVLAIKDEKLLRQIEQKILNLGKKAVKILEEKHRSL